VRIKPELPIKLLNSVDVTDGEQEMRIGSKMSLYISKFTTLLFALISLNGREY